MSPLSLLLAAESTAAAASPTVTLPWDSPTLWVGMIVLGIPTLIGAINGLLQIVKHFRPDPPTHREYATKGEVLALEQRMTSDLNVDANALKAFERRVTESQLLMEERLNEAREAMEKRVSSHLDQQDRHHNSTQAELRTIATQLGRLSGLLEKPRR